MDDPADRPGHQLLAVSCVTTALCVVGNDAGSIFTSIAPATPNPRWAQARISKAAINSVSCASTHMCVAVDEDAKELNSIEPASGRGEWTISPTTLSWSPAWAVSCPVVSFCEATDDGGGVAAGGPTPSNLTQPTITGEPTRNAIVSVRSGTWIGTPTRFKDQWERCDATGAECSTSRTQPRLTTCSRQLTSATRSAYWSPAQTRTAPVPWWHRGGPPSSLSVRAIGSPPRRERSAMCVSAKGQRWQYAPPSRQEPGAAARGTELSAWQPPSWLTNAAWRLSRARTSKASRDALGALRSRGILQNASHSNGELLHVPAAMQSDLWQGGTSFSGVSCASATECIATGQFDVSGAAAWNGSMWKPTPFMPPATDGSGGPPTIGRSVSCASPRFCVSLTGGPLPDLWNGRRWSQSQAYSGNGTPSGLCA